MNLIQKLKKIYKFLKTTNNTYEIEEDKTLEEIQYLYEILYRSNSYEKKRYYDVSNNGTGKFWSNVRNSNITCKSSSIGGDTVNVLSTIVNKNLNEIKIENETLQEKVEKLDDNNKLKKMINEGTVDGLIVGDSVFTVDILKDNTINLQEYNGRYIDVEMDSVGDIYRIITYKEFYENDKRYKLKNIYEKGHNYNELYKEDKRIDFYSLDYTSNLLEDYTFNIDILTAILYTPLGISHIYKGRGKSVLEGKEDALDFIDMTFSIWSTTLVKSLPYSYLPPNQIRVDENGNRIRPNLFNHQFVLTEGAAPDSTSSNKVEFTQAQVQIDSLERSMSQAISEFCQGIISPSSLAISDKKYRDANASYATELEKQTLTTINTIFDNLTESVKQLIFIYLTLDTEKYNTELLEQITVKYSQYASPSFESKIDIVNKGKEVMSIETQIDYLYGDDMTDEWKKEEIERLRGEVKQEVVEEENIEEETDGDIEEDEKEDIE